VASPEPLSVDDALDRLVNQFSDSMAFFRELIQNAIDAGSEEVEVRFEHRDGRMIISVDDWGEGMNREIIETRLTRLFSSAKDGDRTKIGKFGIGFVSVFAIDPEAVCIDTSRDGEHWRILFDDKRKFSLIRREQPIEGTKLQIFKKVSVAEYQQFRTRAREVVRYWCKHVGSEIRVDGQQINEPFDLERAPVKLRRGHDEELLVVGHPLDGQAFAGYYNRGLTLVEEQTIPGIAFKVSSPHLEHTLTRDDVIREAGFMRLVDRIHALIGSELCEQVFVALGEAVAKLDPSQPLGKDQRDQLEYLWGAARHHMQAKHARSSETAKLPLFRSPSGAALDLRKLERREVIVAPRPSAVTEALERSGATVVWLPDECSKGRVLLDLLARSIADVECWCTALPPRDDDEARRWQVLARSVETLLDEWGAKLDGVRLAHLAYDGSSVLHRVAITQAEFGEATRLDDAAAIGTGLLASRRLVVLNADHPTIRTIAGLAQSEPELAAYFAVKAFLLGTRLDAETDQRLVTLTHDHRAQRVSG
jgi:molecular chaperone HtpG